MGGAGLGVAVSLFAGVAVASAERSFGSGRAVAGVETSSVAEDDGGPEALAPQPKITQHMPTLKRMVVR